MIYQTSAIQQEKQTSTTPNTRETIQALAQCYQALLKDGLNVYQETEQAIAIIEALEIGAKDTKPSLRQLSLEALTALILSNQCTMEQLQEALTCPSYETRVNAVRSLSRLKQLSARIELILRDAQEDSESARPSLKT